MARRAFTDRDHSQAQELLDKVRRTASDRDNGDVLYNPQTFEALKPALGHKSLTLAFMRSRLETIDKLQQAVIDLVKHRLQVHDVHHPPLNVTNMSWCIPREHKEEPAWRLLLEDPLLFTSDMLESLIALDEWTADTSNTGAKSNLLYIRTFQVPVALLQQTLDNMLEDGYGTHDRIHYWQNRISEEGAAEDGTVYTLRYCGQTTGSPWERHRGDMYNQLQTFLGRLLRVLGQTAQGVKVLTSAKVHTVSAALTQASTEISDLREQILIALFGDGALNTQAGGKDVITLYKEDRDNFDRLRTNTTESMILRQCMPSVLNNGSAIMVTIGSDLGEDHESAEDTFWIAGGRSADAVTRIYNFFASWEGPTALESVNPNATRMLAGNGHFPLVDLFPWFRKSEKDFLKASDLLRRYMNVAKPMIALAYGERLVSFRDFTASDFGSWARMGYNHGRAAESGQLLLTYFDGKDSNHDPETATVLIPSLHPGFLSRAGIVKEKATRVFVLTSAVAWCAMSAALRIAEAGMPTNREVYANMIIENVNAVAGPSTVFGKALAAARKEYDDCHRAYGEGQAKRRRAPELKIPTGILATKSIRAKRKLRYAEASSDQSAEGIGGWEVAVGKDATFERSHELYTLTWKEEDVSTILVSMSVRHYEEAYDFLEHWEDRTGLFFADEIISAHKLKTVEATGGYIPLSFFDGYSSRFGLPFPPASLLTDKTMPKFVPKVQSDLPANPSDLLWLLEQFFLETFPSGGDIDPVSVSEHPTYSVFGKLMDFATRIKYQHHPHINTIKAMAHLSEQGTDERRMSLNILILSCEFLRPGYVSKGKQLGRTLPDGTKLRTSRVVRTINAGPAPATNVGLASIPDMEQDEEELGEVEDFTDDEATDEHDNEDSDGGDGNDGSDGDDGEDGGELMDVDSAKRAKRKRDDEDEDEDGGKGAYSDMTDRKSRFGLRRTKAM
ncbi:hypothetical protein SNOG_13956 [Parastagonospora nodorum SN15]|uniref:Uncharacterized protein n=1 Tax=Phaeosphaeria nodorum (strain SN15 / ATCC MYA-4574 / FGSC 10173) TaxID=321614 RepID=Q0U2T5_PHANO|nr:hypothetical protein SNOG_13956 [Parastagonospora nodorum SN15]EAT78581.2 hypothetical protein SNOG_13956 [Parastagonospora nodorum SN15]